MITISSKTCIYNLVQSHPDLKDILVQIGFDQLIVPGMLQSVGRIITLEKGCKIKRMELSDVKLELETRGYHLTDINEKEDTDAL